MRTITGMLLPKGVGALYYDKRPAWEVASFDDLAGDALAWIGALERDPRINGSAIGLMGFSQGGWIGPLVAARRPKTAFLVTVSASGVPPLEQGWFMASNNDRRAGLTPGEVLASDSLRRALSHYYANPTESRREQAQALLSAARQGSWLGRVRMEELQGVNDTVPGPEAIQSAARRIPGLAAYGRLAGFDPTVALRSTRLPFLGIWGGSDEIVPADTSRGIIERELAVAGNRDVTLRTFIGANHGLLVAPLRIPIPYAPGYLELVRDWIADRVPVAAPARGSSLRSYELQITVPPNAAVSNTVTFFGADSGGVFLDQNMHTGTWHRRGLDIEWEYTSVPDLVNRFVGTLSESGDAIVGRNHGRWQGVDFNGDWTGKATIASPR